jgi:hypothetical protein
MRETLNPCVERTGKRRHFMPPFLPAAHAHRWAAYDLVSVHYVERYDILYRNE